MDIKLKNIEGLLESWKNEDVISEKNSEDLVIKSKDTFIHNPKASKKESSKKSCSLSIEKNKETLRTIYEEHSEPHSFFLKSSKVKM